MKKNKKTFPKTQFPNHKPKWRIAIREVSHFLEFLIFGFERIKNFIFYTSVITRDKAHLDTRGVAVLHVACCPRDLSG